MYNIVQCLCKMKTKNSLKYCAMSSALLLWNVTVQFDLCILKIHFFTSIYLYVLLYVCTEKKENVYFFILVDACLNMCLFPSAQFFVFLFF